MDRPTVIDDSFTYDKENYAWVQKDTGITVTTGYIEMMRIPITNTVYVESQRKRKEGTSGQGWPRFPKSEIVKAILSFEKGDSLLTPPDGAPEETHDE